MYYLVAEQKLLNKRYVFSVSNGDCVFDVFDDFVNAEPRYNYLDKKTLKKFLEKGYETKEAARDLEIMSYIGNFAGPLFHITYSVLTEKELLALYNRCIASMGE